MAGIFLNFCFLPHHNAVAHAGNWTCTIGPRIVRCRCRLNGARCSKCPEAFSAACFKIVLPFWPVKPYQYWLLPSLIALAHSHEVSHSYMFRIVDFVMQINVCVTGFRCETWMFRQILRKNPPRWSSGYMVLDFWPAGPETESQLRRPSWNGGSMLEDCVHFNLNARWRTHGDKYFRSTPLRRPS